MRPRFAFIFVLLLASACSSGESPQPAPAATTTPPASTAKPAGGRLFVTNEVGGDISVQTRRVLDNLAAILAAAGASFADVVKTTVYLLDMDDFAAMNAIYATYVTAPPPARATVQVSRLPRDVRVEIDVIARLG